MRVLCIIALCAILAVGASASLADFKAFTAKFNKTYANDQEAFFRFQVFTDNMKRVAELRASQQAATGKSADAVFGVTKFADMTPQEFKQHYFGFVPGTALPEVPVKPVTSGAIPTSFDWRTKGVVTPVKNQEQCGSCWAFSATEEIESQWAMKGNKLIELSPQQIVSCDTGDDGCNGGWPVGAYQYVQQAGGIELNSKYPYTSGGGDSGTCKSNNKDFVVTVSNYSYATPPCSGSCDNQNENTLLDNLVAHGPVSICVDAEPWQLYTGGVLSSGCSHGYDDLDHCVQLVGYDKTGSSPYYIIRNSWGTDWGEQGYIYVEIGHNLCGVADQATLVDATSA